MGYFAHHNMCVGLVRESPIINDRSGGSVASFDLICDKCGYDFEVFRQGFLKDEDRVCPSCGSTKVRQKFTGFLKNIGGGCATQPGSPFG
jgi:putative FmdB family regulatory protein